jgi:hypothetical protein
VDTFKVIFDAFVESVKMQDKVNHISSELDKLKNDVHSISGRLIRLETLIEVNEKQKSISHRLLVSE